MFYSVKVQERGSVLYILLKSQSFCGPMSLASDPHKCFFLYHIPIPLLLRQESRESWNEKNLLPQLWDMLW